MRERAPGQMRRASSPGELKPYATIWMATVLLLSACNSPDDSKKEQAAVRPTTPAHIEVKQREAERIIDQEMAKVQRKEASTWPCSLFPQSELEALVGNPLEQGSYAFNNVSENDHEYKSESCDWSATGGKGNEVRLWVSVAKHFKSGQVECSPGSANQRIPGIGDQAWWDYQKYWGGGTLRVCSPKAMLEVKVTVTNKDEGTARKIAETMATKVLGS